MPNPPTLLRPPRRRRRAAGILLAAATCAVPLALAGCRYTERAVNTQLFRESVIRCTESIRAGDLARAEVQLASARQLADSPAQHQKLRSLATLIEGAEAMLHGDSRAAAASWSRIEDPHLRAEVRAKARAVDLDVPLSPLAKGGAR
jgi:hypothetical protein